MVNYDNLITSLQELHDRLYFDAYRSQQMSLNVAERLAREAESVKLAIDIVYRVKDLDK